MLTGSAAEYKYDLQCTAVIRLKFEAVQLELGYI